MCFSVLSDIAYVFRLFSVKYFLASICEGYYANKYCFLARLAQHHGESMLVLYLYSFGIFKEAC